MFKRIALLLVAVLLIMGFQVASAEEGTALCHTWQELEEALNDDSVHTITLGDSIVITGHISAQLKRPVTVDMGPYGISFDGAFSSITVFGPVLFTGEGGTVPLFTMGFRQFCTLYGGTVEATADHAVALLFTSSGGLGSYPMRVCANGADSVAVKGQADLSVSFAAIEATGPGGIGVQATGTVSVALSEITAHGQALEAGETFIFSSRVSSNGMVHESLPLQAKISNTNDDGWVFELQEEIILPHQVYLRFIGGKEVLLYNPPLDIVWQLPEVDGVGPYVAQGYVDGTFEGFAVDNLNPISRIIQVYDNGGLYLFADEMIPFYDANTGDLFLRCLTGEDVGGTVAAWISQDDGETFTPLELQFPEVHEGPDFFVELVHVFLDPSKTYQIYIELQTEAGIMESNLLILSVDNNNWSITVGGDRNGTGRNPDTEPPEREVLVPSWPEEADEPEATLPQHPAQTDEPENEEKPPIADDLTADDVAHAPDPGPDAAPQAPEAHLAEPDPQAAAEPQEPLSPDDSDGRGHATATQPPATVEEVSPPLDSESGMPQEADSQDDRAPTAALPEASQTTPPPQTTRSEPATEAAAPVAHAITAQMPDESPDNIGLMTAALSAAALVSVSALAWVSLKGVAAMRLSGRKK